MGNETKLLAISLVALLVGCAEPKYPQYEVDQIARQRIFKDCMAALPAGPQSTKYNDWDEVVEKCDAVAYRQAQVCYENCPLAAKEQNRG